MARTTDARKLYFMAKSNRERMRNNDCESYLSKYADLLVYIFIIMEASKPLLLFLTLAKFTRLNKVDLNEVGLK